MRLKLLLRVVSVVLNADRGRFLSNTSPARARSEIYRRPQTMATKFAVCRTNSDLNLLKYGDSLDFLKSRY